MKDSKSVNKQMVLVISGAGGNNAIHGLMADYSAALESAGHSILQVTVDPAELQYGVELMQKGGVSFAMTWLGIGQDLRVQTDRSVVNAFEYFGIPLVKLQGDLPAYFGERHADLPRNTVNLYQAAEFVQYRRRWMPEANALTSLIPPMPMVPMGRDRVDSNKRRNGKLFFLKNGNSPAELRNLWRSRLPSTVAQLADAIAEEIVSVGTKPGVLHIGDFVADFIRATGMSADPPRNLIAFLSAQMDDYLRRIKSTMIAQAILDLPVVVQGSFWEHVDFKGKRAQLVEGMDVDASQDILHSQLGVIDMSPNVDGWPHDRVQRAAGSYSLVLTNRQGWLSERFADFEEFAFEFNPESIRDRVHDAIANPGRYIEQAVAFGERFREVYPRHAFGQRVVELVDLAKLLWNEPKPLLQPYFAWPVGGSGDSPR
jgi:hypothetical protein